MNPAIVSGAWWPFSLARFVPPHARTCSMALSMTPVGTTALATLTIRKAAVVSNAYSMASSATNLLTVHRDVEFVVPDNGGGVYGAMQFFTSVTADTPSIYGDIAGFSE